MKELKKNWQAILLIATIIGYGITVGVYKQKIDTLEKNQAEMNEFIKQQIAINANLTTIVTILSED